MLAFRFALLGAALFPMTALAADYGTYRAGNSYMSMPAQNPEQCISFCNGDAQCKGWNFVKVNQSHTICEFNASQASPIASAISISGDSATAMNHRGLVPGGQRTTRVGQSAAQFSQARHTTRVGQTAPSRKVVRTPVPQRDPRLEIANYRAPVAGIATPGATRAPMPQRAIQQVPPARSMAFRPQLDVLPSSHRSVPQRPLQTTAKPKFRPILDSATPHQSAQLPARPPEPPIAEPPTIGAEDLDSIPKISAMPQNRPNPSVEAGLAGGPVALSLPPNSSLFGSLYDDVKAPRSLTPSDIPADPDAPIPTVSSVPVESLNVSTF